MLLIHKEFDFASFQTELNAFKYRCSATMVSLNTLRGITPQCVSPDVVQANSVFISLRLQSGSSDFAEIYCKV